ncbi:PAS domain S-box protein [Nocardioides sp.]|uniref:sensor histidine kinase n=1 Tax=Nocardioides sp. TaxID=35761 RepID=UPI002631478F|nr:PAS domain S-box protein [Nocardioides sp.]MDI6912554.1 PAS domain S-box protein [Nocardioides sp.]
MRSFEVAAIFTVDESLRFLSVNGNGLAPLGLSRETLEGKTLFEVFPADTVRVAEPWFRDALAGRSSTVDVPLTDKIFSQHLTPIRDESGQVVAALGVVDDVTDRRAGERARSESDERFRLSFLHAPIGKALVELDGRLREVNTAFAKLTQYSEHELVARSFQDITHPDDLDADLDHLSRWLAGEADTYALEKRYITGSGSIVWAQLSVTLVRDPEGEPQYFIAQIQDLTDRKAYEASLRDMIATLSHDLRTPISVVTGYVEMLLDSWDSLSDEDRHNHLLKTNAAAHSVQALLENILTVSALDDAGFSTTPTSVRVNEVVGEVLEGLNLTFSITLRTSGDATAHVDRDHLARIMTNLITNAGKYGAEPVVVSIRTDTLWVTTEVADRGPGVPSEFEAHLFDRFTRSENARSGRERGSGLGLHIVRRLVLLNGGDVRYTPTPGGGRRSPFAYPVPPTHLRTCGVLTSSRSHLRDSWLTIAMCRETAEDQLADRRRAASRVRSWIL